MIGHSSALQVKVLGWGSVPIPRCTGKVKLKMHIKMDHTGSADPIQFDEGFDGRREDWKPLARSSRKDVPARISLGALTLATWSTQSNSRHQPFPDKRHNPSACQGHPRLVTTHGFEDACFG